MTTYMWSQLHRSNDIIMFYYQQRWKELIEKTLPSTRNRYSPFNDIMICKFDI